MLGVSLTSRPLHFGKQLLWWPGYTLAVGEELQLGRSRGETVRGMLVTWRWHLDRKYDVSWWQFQKRWVEKPQKLV